LWQDALVETCYQKADGGGVTLSRTKEGSKRISKKFAGTGEFICRILVILNVSGCCAT
jgi:hypothetical protein